MSLEILQDLYDSDISFEISACWNNGFNFVLGEIYYDNIRASETFCDFKEGIHFLRDNAIVFYPDSDFARKYK